jgi:hypothetical protein
MTTATNYDVIQIYLDGVWAGSGRVDDTAS